METDLILQEELHNRKPGKEFPILPMAAGGIILVKPTGFNNRRTGNLQETLSSRVEIAFRNNAILNHLPAATEEALVVIGAVLNNQAVGFNHKVTAHRHAVLNAAMEVAEVVQAEAFQDLPVEVEIMTVGMVLPVVAVVAQEDLDDLTFIKTYFAVPVIIRGLFLLYRDPLSGYYSMGINKV